MADTGDAAAGARARYRGFPSGSLLGGLDEAARSTLLSLGVFRQFPPDRIVMREGDEGAFSLILLDGVVKATGLGHDGRAVLVAVRIGGDLVGEFSVMDGRARSSTVTTCGAVLARVVTRAELLGCLRASGPIAEAVNRAIIGKIRSANERMIDFVGCDAATRVVRVLYQVALDYGEPARGGGVVIRWRLTQPELATLAGVSEPTMQKVLRRLRAAGLVSTGYATVTVHDMGQLKLLAYGEPGA